jgi:glycine dehydrogenase
MITDLTALPIANASLLDEGTAAAEAMAMCEGIHNKKRKTNPAKRFFVDQKVYRQTLDVIITRARPLHIEVVIGDWQSFEFSDDYFGVLIQYPNSEGNINDYQSFAASCNAKEIQVIVAADIMSLALLTPPGEWGADVVVGNTQRFGVPKGYGGPHAAFFATKEDNKRLIPGRIIGLSVDINGDPALRMALQTREQHIRREKATSNICTAQALLSIMASMYAVYHGPDGIKEIASGIHKLTAILAGNLKSMNVEVINDNFFDTITIKTDADKVNKIKSVSESEGINFFYPGNDKVSISLDESVNLEDVKDICKIFASVFKAANSFDDTGKNHAFGPMARKSDILTHPVFSMYHTESKMMRYIKSLENKDLSLVHSMISLGSCTMKLNAASEMIPVSWPEFSSIHPFAPADQTLGYQQIFVELEAYLAEITGFDACSLQPNSGAQGEYAGLLTIRAYHQDRNELNRNIALIPSSAHGTNPASAVMCGMEVVVIGCDEKGNVDMDDLRLKAEQHSNNLSCLMITYPSTHGVFETSIKEICDLIHHHGGLVYMDGANMNAQVGLTSPGIIGADVCHLNLHKTFAIPHGGGGPGMGPICVNKNLLHSSLVIPSFIPAAAKLFPQCLPHHGVAQVYCLYLTDISGCLEQKE